MGFVDKMKNMNTKQWCLLGIIVLCCVILLVGVILHQDNQDKDVSSGKDETQKVEISEENDNNGQQDSDSEEPETGSSESSVTNWDEPTDSESIAKEDSSKEETAEQDSTKEESDEKDSTKEESSEKDSSEEEPAQKEENKESSVDVVGENNEKGWGTIR